VHAMVGRVSLLTEALGGLAAPEPRRTTRARPLVLTNERTPSWGSVHQSAQPATDPTRARAVLNIRPAHGCLWNPSIMSVYMVSLAR
jgi:hypothetical protein